jgi:ABC-type uncharacterized transport system YnjBCD ATPase subunit
LASFARPGAPTRLRGLGSTNDWVEERGLPRGLVASDFADAATGGQQAVLGLAWPNAIQEELSQPVAVLLNEPSDVLAIASQAGFRCFVSVAAFKDYVDAEKLVQGVAA